MSLAAWVLAAVLVTLLVRRWKSSSGALPPGPRPVPILGNVLDLQAKELWLVAEKWAKKFGDVAYLHVAGQGLVFATMDLLDKKGSIYGDKPTLVMAGELCGCDNMVAFTRYGDTSRRQRKLINQAFGVQVIPAYHPLIEAETLSFIRSLVADPSNYIAHTRRYAGGMTLSVVYGYEAAGNNDKFLNLGEECVDLLSNKIASGGGIVRVFFLDIFPSLKRLPTWAPGSGFLIKAAQWKAKMDEFVDRPYEFVKASLKSGTYVPSFCSMLLEDEKKCTPQFEFDLKQTANSMYSASMDTTITVFCHFLLAMVLHPEVLIKAQKEIDSVVGTDRLPTFSDRASLPFVDAVLSEVYRWGVPVPLSLPHRLMEDDVYRGMLIPKGSLIFGNVWAITRDETLFPNASAFLPERYLEKVEPALAKKRDPRSYVFGFGRRRCPGVNLVESSVWILITSVLATLDISKAKDSFGNPVEPKIDFNNSVFRMPDHFDCDIRPRSEQALKLLRQAEADRS
ncbi:cytochrome P450 [Mycena alexandri]|uniref:Cytochrome P450 n=1 Tax=Mycena alexandri TaxID=1745969 RepID=A0AAD6SZL2_9AGAR|nr:cytochrome P450 [Mycena alexandri]